MKLLVPMIALGLLSSVVEASELKTFDARYEATALGMSTTAYRSMTLNDEDIYQLRNTLTLTLLGATVGSVTETSQFRWQDNQLTPLEYHYRQTGISATSESIEFDAQAGLARSTVDSQSWELPLEIGYLDKLSYGTQLGQDIANGSQQEFSYQVVDGDEVESHVYRIVAEELLDTPLGQLKTVKVERVRRSSGSRRTTVWLASDWDYLLVRLEQVSSSGRLTELNLESATFGDTAVVGSTDTDR